MSERSGQFIRTVVVLGALTLAACKAEAQASVDSNGHVDSNGDNGNLEGGGDPRALVLAASKETATVVPPTATATEVPPPIATKEAEMEFAQNRVYRFKDEAGGEGAFIIGPKGVVFQISDPRVNCGNLNIRPLRFLTKPIPTEGSKFKYNLTTPVSQIVEGELQKDGTVKGKVGNNAYSLPSPTPGGAELKCPANERNWTANYVDDGSDVFKRELASVLGQALGPSVVQVVDSYLGR